MAIPRLNAPLSRYLAVTDIPRSLAFYRDVLGMTEQAVTDDGFEAQVEVLRDAARLQLGVPVPGKTQRHKILFFGTDDVAGLRAEIASRGGNPSPAERVNWIKMEMFEVRDPDGHVLWFGQSFHQPSHDLRGNLRQIMPSLPLNDVPSGVAWYQDVLGFSVNYAQHDLGVMDRDEVRILLVARKPQHSGVGSCCVYVNDADALYGEFQRQGVKIDGPPVSHPWGLRDFTVFDPEGNELTFAQTFE